MGIAARELSHYVIRPTLLYLGQDNPDAEALLLGIAASQSHLELVSSRGGPEHTLLHALNRTSTPMGARRLRRWVLHPLRDLARLTARQEVIASLLQEPMLLGQIRDLLKDVRDLERTAGRLSQGSGNARDLVSLAQALEIVPPLKLLRLLRPLPLKGPNNGYQDYDPGWR